MTKLSILSAIEQRRFDSPPKFRGDDRSLHFSLTKNELQLLEKIRMPTNKIGFVLQLGYFRSNGKFFTVEQFRPQDAEYVAKILGISHENISLLAYKKKTPINHRRQVLDLLGWQPFNKTQQQKAIDHIEWLIQKQLSPKHVFLSLIDFFWQNKIELPSSHTLSTFITEAYNHFEKELISILANKLTQYHREKLDKWVGITNKKAMQRPMITLIKQVNQSLRPSDIQENVEAFKIFREGFYEFLPIIKEVDSLTA